MSWRYQPVYTEENGDRVLSICEVHFDESGTFDGWTESEALAPSGSDLEELAGDLSRMLVDAFSWEPVRFSDLKPGMAFVPRISMDARRGVADYIEECKDTFRRQPRPITN